MWQSQVKPELPAGQQPTPSDTIGRMIDGMRLMRSDVLADLGCGDGRILIAAAKRIGCRCIGIEIDAEQCQRAREAVIAEGLESLITIIEGDILDFVPERHGVTAITAYLFDDLLQQVSPLFRRVRVAATPFHRVVGMAATQYGDVWIYRLKPEQQPMDNLSGALQLTPADAVAAALGSYGMEGA
jgi:SAM-dependent methyltransferase